MAAQSVSSTSRVHQSSSASSADPGKLKRARTKHACDECRRSQKKSIDACTYTPHKSRSQCACTGQNDDARRDALVPDVFIFPDTSLSSFHTWSAASSPDQSPTTSGSGLDTPSTTYLTHSERHEAARSVIFQSSTTASQTGQLENLPPRGSQLYSQRSRSVPNVSRINNASSPYRTTSFSSTFTSPTPLQHPLDQVAAMLEPNSVSSSHICQQASQQLDCPSPATHNEPMLSHHMQLDVTPDSVLDYVHQYDQHEPNMGIGHRQVPFFNNEAPSFLPAMQQPYNVHNQFYQHSRNGYDFPTTTSMDLDLQPSPTSSFFALSHTVDSETVEAHQDQASQIGVNTTPQQLHIDQFTQFVHTAHARQDSYTQLRASELEPASMDGRHAHDMHLHLPPSRFPQTQWRNEFSVSPASGSPSSAYPSPAAYGNFEFYDWAQ
ncbi:hypothetical protein EW145_g2264 [Phellinidium pouzarii]|uniref:Uncharacterized protein n=1 Tax=Phellinidium pouzarii TaxID=167371 RepID=A0A4S4LBZ5_9AGAM|nr:hypothetical protein EW145_g2264 [Phellinidium pouzarii]